MGRSSATLIGFLAGIAAGAAIALYLKSSSDPEEIREMPLPFRDLVNRVSERVNTSIRNRFVRDSEDFEDHVEHI